MGGGDDDNTVQGNGSRAGQTNGTAASSFLRTALTTNGTRKSDPALNGSSNGEKSDDQRPPQPPLYFGHDRSEVTRILIQALSDMGYQTAAESVSRDSGYDLESQSVAAFRSAVLAGEWTDAEQLLAGATTSDGRGGEEGNGLVLAPGSDPKVMRFWIRQQKYLELLEQKDTGLALTALRGELTPLYNDMSKVHFLSSLLMCRSTEDLMAKADWDGAEGQSRRLLLSQLSSESRPVE